jgi:hypothetical protein
LGHAFHVFHRHGIGIVFKAFVVIETKAVKFVQRSHITKGIVALIRNLLLADQFLFRAG